jgi:hypothetical protein
VAITVTTILVSVAMTMPIVPDEAVLQHYLSPEIAFSWPDKPEDELFIRIHHRSTGYGLFWDTSTGSNIVSVGLRFRR